MAFTIDQVRKSAAASKMKTILTSMLQLNDNEVLGLLEGNLRECAAYILGRGRHSKPILELVYSWSTNVLLAEINKMYSDDKDSFEQFLRTSTIPGVAAYLRGRHKRSKAREAAPNSEFMLKILQFCKGDKVRAIGVLRRYMAYELTGSPDPERLRQLNLYDMDRLYDLMAMGSDFYEFDQSNLYLRLNIEALIEVTDKIRLRDCYLVYDGKF